MTLRDGLVIGLVQCFSLVPGVSRSGATISAGLFRGLDRLTATRLSFFLAIPALTAAGLFEAAQRDRPPRSCSASGQIVVGIVVSFVVAYASIAWLLRFVEQQHDHGVRLVPRRARCRAARRPLAAGWMTAT